MGDGKEVTPEKKSRRVPRWAKVMTGLILIWMVLNTEINLNPPLESLADPNVDVEAAIEKKDQGDYAALVPVLIRGIAEAEDKAYFHYVLAEYYRKGAPPFHVDHCSAFDHYFQAAKLGDTDAQLKVADMFITGIGGYKDFEHAYGWAKYAEKHGNKNADFVLDRSAIKSIPESVRSLLDRQLSVWTPKDSELNKAYRIPLVPGIWKVLQLFIRVRVCDDPTVWDHLFGD